MHLHKRIYEHFKYKYTKAMMRRESIYKHLKSKYADKMMRQGKIKIGTLNEYRIIENEAIRDIEEGKGSRYYKAHNVKYRKKTYHKQNVLLKKMLLPPEKGVAKLINVTFEEPVNLHDIYIYSCSKSDERNLFSNYNSCVKIFKIYEFYQEIYKALYNHKLIIQDQCYFGKIKYVNERRLTTRSDLIEFAYIKNERSKNEKEVRFAFIPNKSKNLKPLVIKIKNIKDYCERIY